MNIPFIDALAAEKRYMNFQLSNNLPESFKKLIGLRDNFLSLSYAAFMSKTPDDSSFDEYASRVLSKDQETAVFLEALGPKYEKAKSVLLQRVIGGGKWPKSPENALNLIERFHKTERQNIETIPFSPELIAHLAQEVKQHGKQNVVKSANATVSKLKSAKDDKKGKLGHNEGKVKHMAKAKPRHNKSGTRHHDKSDMSKPKKDKKDAKDVPSPDSENEEDFPPRAQAFATKADDTTDSSEEEQQHPKNREWNVLFTRRESGHKRHKAHAHVTYCSNDLSAFYKIDDQLTGRGHSTLQNSQSLHTSIERSTKAMFDSGANINLTGNKNVLTNLIKLKKRHAITSSEKSDGLVATHAGLYLNEVTVLYAPKAQNDLVILGRDTLTRRGKVWSSDGKEFDRKNVINDGSYRDYFQPYDSNVVWIFEVEPNGLSYLKKKISSQDFQNLCEGSSSESFFTTFVTQMETVKKNAAKFNVRDVNRANKARHIHDALSGMNVRQIAATINSGSIISNATARDFLVANQILGQNVSSAKGKRKQLHIPNEMVEKSYRPITVIEQKLSMDIFFVEGFAFIISVSIPMDYTDVQWITKPSLDHVVPAMQTIVSRYKRNGHTISYLQWDNQSGLAELNIKHGHGLPHIVIEQGGKKAGVAERKIQTIKSNLRADLARLPYTAFGYLLVYGVGWGTESTNLLVSKSSPSMPSPYVQMKGFKPTEEQVLSHSWGQYGMVTEPVPASQKNLVTVPRARVVLLLERPGRPGTTALFLDVDQLLPGPGYASRIVTVARNLRFFTPLPCPDSFIKQIALREKKPYRI